jgi:hypothetical protein
MNNKEALTIDLLSIELLGVCIDLTVNEEA